jgi:heme iron utilization protein
LRYIAGFGRMGYSDATQWQDSPCLSLEQEALWLDQIKAAGDMHLTGIDFDGMDVYQNGKLIRYGLQTRPLDTDALYAAVTRQLDAA